MSFSLQELYKGYNNSSVNNTNISKLRELYKRDIKINHCSHILDRMQVEASHGRNYLRYDESFDGFDSFKERLIKEGFIVKHVTSPDGYQFWSIKW